MQIYKLVDLNKLRTAPILNNYQLRKLLEELENELFDCDWITIGIMAKNDFDAKTTLLSMTRKYPNLNFKKIENLETSGPVFLKANQKTEEVYIRTEYGLGEGILLTCQYDNETKHSNTYGPLPLNFFNT